MSAELSPAATLPLKRLITTIESGVSVNAIDSAAGEGELGVLKTSCVYTGQFDSAENKTVLPEEHSRVACPVRAGTLIVSRMNTPDLVGAAGYVSKDEPSIFLPDRLWRVSVDRTLAEPKFVYWWTQSTLYRDQVRVACAGTSSSMQNLDQDSFRSFSVPGLSLYQQERIAKFLDEQTERIDALIAEKELLISRLDELRWARVAQELLNKPHGASKPLRLKYLVESCQNGLWGDEATEDGPNVVVVRVADFDKKNRRVSLDNPTYRHIEQDKLSSRLLRKGDLLIEKSGGGPTTPVGNVVMFDADVPAICSNFVARMPVAQGNDPAFVCLLFQALYALGRNVPHIKQTSGIQNLDSESYLSQTVPVPPREEQQKMARRILCTFEAMESLEEASATSVTRLREYRSSLISVAVTGQLDISSFS